jgi:hypothetical protein
MVGKKRESEKTASETNNTSGKNRGKVYGLFES